MALIINSKFETQTYVFGFVMGISILSCELTAYFCLFINKAATITKHQEVKITGWKR